MCELTGLCKAKVLLFLDFFMALQRQTYALNQQNLDSNTFEFRCFPFKQIPNKVRCLNCFQSTQAHLKDPSEIDTKT